MSAYERISYRIVFRFFLVFIANCTSAYCRILISPVRGHPFIVDAARIVCGAGSLKRSDVRPSVCSSGCLSHYLTAAACGGFAAECPASRRYRSAAAGAQQQQRRSTGRLAANVGSVMLTVELTTLNTYVFKEIK